MGIRDGLRGDPRGAVAAAAKAAKLRGHPGALHLIVEEADLLAAVDDRTRLVAVSQVSFYTGQNLDIAQLADGLKNHKALLAIDTTHASGVIQVDATAADLCAALCSFQS